MELKQIKPPLLDQTASYPSVHLEGFTQDKFDYVQIFEISQTLRSSKKDKLTKLDCQIICISYKTINEI